MDIITNPIKIKEVQKLIEKTWKSESITKYENVKLGVKHGNKTFDVHYIEKYNLWGSVNQIQPTKIWNAFGIGNPLESKSIVVEINFNINDELRTSGLIAENAIGEKFILHKGKLGGNYLSISFWDYYQGESCIIKDRKYAIVSKLDSSILVENINSFVREIERIKTLNEGRT